MQNKFSKVELNFFEEILNTVSPSGSEEEVSLIIASFLHDFCNIEYDVMGNMYAFLGKNPSQKGLMLTAHIDEVGFQVTRITNDGMVYVRKLGGLDRQTAPGTKLVIAGKSRELIGVFGKSSPHVQKDDEKQKVPDYDCLWVDFGFTNRNQALNFITIGDFLGVIPDVRYTITGESIISKGLDNKISAFILAVTLRRLAVDKQLTEDTTFVFTVQEEIGCRGAIVATNRLCPEKAICLDVGIATDIPTMKMESSYSEFYLHNGLGLCVAPDNNLNMIKRLKQIGEKFNIPYQIITGLRPAGGTETSRIQIEGYGVSTAHISIPNRYM